MKQKNKNLKKYTKKVINLSFKDILLPKLDLLINKSILVAFSGGKDSIALLDFLNCNKEIFSYSIVACHVNHGLRDNAIIDEEFCLNFCKENNINIEIVNISNDIKNDFSAGIEDTARRYRYKALQTIADKLDCDYILTAHTFDDQIESFFTDIYTGASIFTLGGIKYKSGKILRLMLDISTDKILEYLNERKIKNIEDESNNNIRFVRNKVRHNILPFLYDLGSEFVPTILRLQQESIKINDYFYKTTKEAIIYENENIVEIDKDLFLSFDNIQKEYLLSKIFSQKFRFTKSVVYEALKLLDKKSSCRVDLPSKFCFEISFYTIRIFKKNLIKIFSIEKENGIDSIITSDFKFIFKDKFINNSFTIRNRRDGDRLISGKKLKDVYSNKKIDLFIRDVSIVIAVGSKVLWSECLDINNEFVVFERIISEKS